MRISAKARYGLAAMIYFSTRYPSQTKFTVLEISEALKISKIYLETKGRPHFIIADTNKDDAVRIH